MDNYSFGTIMTSVGMGGTLVSLWLITLVISLMKRLFPVRPQAQAGGAGGEARK
ncbi:MAG: hypothetical protein HY910_00305 [Desulfarculus sp.]|nr:hypothetical protein [Desulfarculus sp.]